MANVLNRIAAVEFVVKRYFWKWEVVARFRYSGQRVAAFWTKRAAERLANRLNSVEAERPAICKRQIEYDQAMWDATERFRCELTAKE